MIKILLVDDHKIVRSALRSVLSAIKHIEIVEEANGGEEAWELVTNNSLGIDVVLMDINMPGIGGFEATCRLLRKYPELKIIMLTAFTNALYPYHLLRIGAKGYLTKDCGQNELVKAIDTVNSGKVYFSSQIANQLMLKEKVSPFYSLSPTEMQIILMLIENESLSEMARRLYLSEKTISTYRHRILKKVGAKNNIELIRLANKEGFLDVPNF